MRKIFHVLFVMLVAGVITGCTKRESMKLSKSASEILGNSDYPAFCFGGFRELTRDSVPTVSQLKEGLGILSAMKVKILRTYNTTGDKQVANLLQAIKELKEKDNNFEMYVMLGAWISCKFSGDSVIHSQESYEANKAEIDEAIRLTKQYPDIVKIIAVGNESMVHWQGYHVGPGIILNWVNHLQSLKKSGDLPADLWITSSDNFASWGGGDVAYHNSELTELVKAVDFVALHTYPFHDTHYTPDFWLRTDSLADTDLEKVHAGMRRASDYAISQFKSVKQYINQLGIKNKPIHLTETGWSSKTNYLYGDEGSRAADEYKQKLYYDQILDWSRKEGVTCFYFEIFDEQWKDANNPLGSENHFGLINLKSEVKYALWDLVDEGVFEGLKRNGYPVTKTFDGNRDELLKTVLPPREYELTPN